MTTNSLFSREALLSAITPAVTTIDIDGVGTVRLRELSVAEVDDARERAKTSSGASFGVILVAYAMVDEANAPLFDVNDLQPLRALASTKFDKIVEAVMIANGYKAPDAKN